MEINQAGLDQLDNGLLVIAKSLASQVASQARVNVPVRTGALRDTIKPSEPIKVTDGVSVDVGTYGSRYGLFVEAGTKNMAAQPFMRLALAQVVGI